MVIDIDGSYMEGGGQIIRTSIGLSALTGKSCIISNIRKGRSSPGLKAQHLSGIRAVANLCDARVNGLNIGSEKIEFYPDKISHKHLEIDISTIRSARERSGSSKSLSLSIALSRDKFLLESGCKRRVSL